MSFYIYKHVSRKQFFLDQINDDFLKQINVDNLSAEECRCIWRKIVLQVVLNPDISISCAQWLLSYASYHQPTTLPHANILYVAVNLFLFGYGSTIFRNHLNIEVFKVLDDIGRYFEENGNQSKQFSPVHKIAHVWGTAAVAFYLASDEHKYLVCASMMRVSFESLGICFLSSGIEPLYILARTRAPDFFSMMAIEPGIKLISPDCVNYFRRKLENNISCIRYSAETVDQFVSEVFNIDQTHNRI